MYASLWKMWQHINYQRQQDDLTALAEAVGVYGEPGAGTYLTGGMFGMILTLAVPSLAGGWPA